MENDPNRKVEDAQAERVDAEADLSAANATLLENPIDERAWFKRGHALERLQKRPGAHQAFLFATAIAPGWPEAWHWLGKVRFDMASFEDALTALEKAYQLGGLGVAVAMDLGHARSARQKDAEALLAFEEAVRRDPSTVDGHYWKASTLMALQRPHDAVNAIDAGLASCPGSPRLLITKARALSQMGANEQARAQLDAAVASASQDSGVWEECGRALQEWGEREEALGAYAQAVALQAPREGRSRPDSPEGIRAHALNWLALGFIQQGRLPDALSAIDEALRILPADDELWNNRGGLLGFMGRMPEAFEAIDYAARARPDEPGRWATRGEALARLGRIEEALASYDEAIRVAKDKARYLMDKGKLMAKLGRRMEALEVVSSSLKEGGMADRSLSDALGEGLREREKKLAAAGQYPTAHRLPLEPYQPPAPFVAPAVTGQCPRCGAPLEWVPGFRRWYCRREDRYL